MNVKQETTTDVVEETKVKITLSEGQQSMIVLFIFSVWGLIGLLVCCCCFFFLDGIIHIVGADTIRLGFMAVVVLGALGGVGYAVYRWYSKKR